MSALEDTGVIIDIPDVDVDSLTTFIRDRVLQRPAVQIEQSALQVAEPVMEVPGDLSTPAEPGPRSPLARSLHSLGSYLEVLHGDLAAVREWQRLEVEAAAGREYRLTQALEQIAGAVASVASDVAQIKGSLTRLEQDLTEVAADVRQVKADRAELGVGRLWSRVRGTGS